MPTPEGTLRSILLDAIAQAARAVVDAEAASVALLDVTAGELVFEAVSGEGSDDLLGARFPADEGFAGEVLRTGRILLIDDIAADPRFARDVAVETGYLPDAIAVIPLRHEGRVAGVLWVLDPTSAPPTSCEAPLAVLARHAEAALDVVAAIKTSLPERS